MNKFLCCLILWSAVVPRLAAQNAAPGGNLLLPTAPYVAPIPAQAQWTMRFTPPGGRAAAKPADGKPAAAPTTDTVVVTKTGDRLRVVVVYADKTRREFWRVGATNIVQDGGKVRVLYATSGYDPIPYAPAQQFFGCEWIKGDSYRDTVKRGEMLCYHYVAEVAVQVPPEVLRSHPELAGKTIHHEAWIDALTSRPVAAMGEFGTIEFTFSDPPPNLVMPDEFQTSFDQQNGAVNRLLSRNRPRS